jgi:hypothetical protein
MGRESRVRRLRRTTSNDMVYATAQELQEQAALIKRATAAGIILATIQAPSPELIRITDGD